MQQNRPGPPLGKSDTLYLLKSLWKPWPHNIRASTLPTPLTMCPTKRGTCYFLFPGEHMLPLLAPQEGMSVGEEMSLSPLIDSNFLSWRNYMEGSELNLNPLNLIKPVLGKSDFNKNLKGREARSDKEANRGRQEQTAHPACRFCVSSARCPWR